MQRGFVEDLFGVDGKVAVVTGGTGVLGGAIARGLARAGARVGILGRRQDRAEAVATDIAQAKGEAMPLVADVLDRGSLEVARHAVLDRWDQIDILICAAGGQVPGSIVNDGESFFDLPEAAIRSTLDLNLLGTVLPCQIFGRAMAQSGRGGSIVTISSMAVNPGLTRAGPYGAAKAAVENFTRWLAVELAHKHGPILRVNAIAPGFFLGEQNRSLLVEPDGSLTDRGRRVIDHTPFGRFGEPDDLVGTVLYLCSPAAAFVTGVVIPIDGGFSVYSGV